MGINRPLLFNAEGNTGVPVKNRFNVGLDFSLGTVDLELPCKRKKEILDGFSGGDASPLVDQ